jgi:hypothetical protein
MAMLGLIKGSRSGRTSGGRGRIGSAVQSAIDRGFVVGSQVRIGKVAGIVVGYNIACFGQFHGAAYPLVVHTPLGISKCGLAEVSLA